MFTNIEWLLIRLAAGRACACRTAWTRAGMATITVQAAARISAPTRTRAEGADEEVTNDGNSANENCGTIMYTCATTK